MRIPEIVFGGMVLAGISMMILGSSMRHSRQAEVLRQRISSESNATTSSTGIIAPEIESLDDSSRTADTK